MRLDAVIYAVGFFYDRILSGPDYDFIIINIAQIRSFCRFGPFWPAAPQNVL